MGMTINEALTWLKVLRTRHAELVALRDENATKRTRLYGQLDKEQIVEPKYDVKKLDSLVTTVAKEIRVVDMAIKRANAVADIGVDLREDVLGTVE